VEGEVGDAAEAAERLAHDGPLLLFFGVVRGQGLPDCFAVFDDAVGAVEFEVLVLDGVVAAHLERGGCDWCGEAGFHVSIQS
jgi:hypothetical protein